MRFTALHMTLNILMYVCAIWSPTQSRLPAPWSKEALIPHRGSGRASGAAHHLEPSPEFPLVIPPLLLRVFAAHITY